METVLILLAIIGAIFAVPSPQVKTAENASPDDSTLN